jgi:hypothetical protein
MTDLQPVSYLNSGGGEGDTIHGTAICDKSKSPGNREHDVMFLVTDKCIVGKSLAYTTVTLRNLSGELVARGSHTK